MAGIISCFLLLDSSVNTCLAVTSLQFADMSSLGSTASAWSTNLTPEQGGHGVDEVSGNIGSVVLSVGLPNWER